MKATCRLCLKMEDLKDSHIWPAFTLRWLKSNSLSPYLRTIGEPNKRKQELPTEKLLCGSCEVKLSKWENEAATKIFKPWNDSRKLPLSYGFWFQKFAISLVWRGAVSCYEDYRDKCPELLECYENALEYWRLFLLGKNKAVKPYEHHVFFFTTTKNLEGPDRLHAYCLRGFDYSYIATKHRVYMYFLVPGMLFFSSIQPTKLRSCKGTLIGKKGEFRPAQVLGEGEIGSFLLSRVEALSAASVSEKQNEIMKKDLQKEIAKEKDSAKLRKKAEAIIADGHWDEN